MFDEHDRELSAAGPQPASLAARGAEQQRRIDSPALDAGWAHRCGGRRRMAIDRPGARAGALRRATRRSTMPRPDQRPVHPPAAAWRRVVTLSEPEPGEPEASTTVYLTDTTSASCVVEDLVRAYRKGSPRSTTDTRSAPEECLTSRKAVLSDDETRRRCPIASTGEAVPWGRLEVAAARPLCCDSSHGESPTCNLEAAPCVIESCKALW